MRATGRHKLIVRALDRDLHGVSRPRRHAGGLRGLSRGGRDRGNTVEAHRAGLERVVQAGGNPSAGSRSPGELQRDWAREETVGRRRRDRAHRAAAKSMSVEAPPRKRAAIADPEAREFLRKVDPVLARLIDERPDFRPRAWLDELPPLDAFGTLVFQVAGQQLSVSSTRRSAPPTRSAARARAHSGWATTPRRCGSGGPATRPSRRSTTAGE